MNGPSSPCSTCRVAAIYLPEPFGGMNAANPVGIRIDSVMQDLDEDDRSGGDLTPSAYQR